MDKAEMGERQFSDFEFRTLLDLYMVVDPWPLTDLHEWQFRKMLETEAKRRGFRNWVQAYHNFGEE